MQLALHRPGSNVATRTGQIPHLKWEFLTNNYLLADLRAGGKSYQEMFVITAIFGMSKAISDRQFNITKGKIPSFNNICHWIPSLLYYTMHVTARLTSYAFLTANYVLYGALVLPPQLLCNCLIAYYVCQENDFIINTLTAFKSLVAPACNIRKGQL